jgi:hypothetical protein
MPVPYSCAIDSAHAYAHSGGNKNEERSSKNIQYYLHKDYGYYMAESFPVDVKLANLPAISARSTWTVSASVRDISESPGRFCDD